PWSVSCRFVWMTPWSVSCRFVWMTPWSGAEIWADAPYDAVTQSAANPIAREVKRDIGFSLEIRGGKTPPLITCFQGSRYHTGVSIFCVGAPGWCRYLESRIGPPIDGEGSPVVIPCSRRIELGSTKRCGGRQSIDQKMTVERLHESGGRLILNAPITRHHRLGAGLQECRCQSKYPLARQEPS